MRHALPWLFLAACTTEIGARAVIPEPGLDIVAPTPHAVVPQGAPLQIAVAVDGVEPDRLTYRFATDRHGTLEGEPEPDPDGVHLVSHDWLRPGMHRLSVRGVGDGPIPDARAHVVFEVVPNTPPTVDWAAPAIDAVVPVGEPLPLVARVADAEEPAARLAVSWFLDGAKLPDTAAPSGAGVVEHTLPTLALGAHTLRATVRDAAGAEASATVWVHAIEADADGDGHVVPALGGDDCDDTDPAVHPGAVEVCNGIDDDCDALVDDADPGWTPRPREVRYVDADGDGYGDERVAACDGLEGLVARGGDCDDGDPEVHPAAAEVCNGDDDDCDGAVDSEDPSLVRDETVPSWPDADADGFGDASAPPLHLCEVPPDRADDALDCDDADPDIHPDATEVCDGHDNDCDALVDDADPSLWDPSAPGAGLVDGDGDGFGAWRDHVCDPGVIASSPEEDCLDVDPSVYPGAPEICGDGIDQDCGADDRACRFAGSYGVEAGLDGHAMTVLRGDGADRLGSALAAAPGMLLAGLPTRDDERGGAVLWQRDDLPRDAVVVGHADATLRVEGTESRALAGTAVGLGDVSDDGTVDVAVSAPGAWTGDTRGGRVYVFLGESGHAGERTVDDADLVVEGAGDDFGHHLLVADVTCDGVDDLVVASTGDGSAGAVHLFFGPLGAGALSVDDANLTIHGESSGDDLGASLAPAGDPTGGHPGCSGLLVGARGAGLLHRSGGAAYLFAASDPLLVGLDAGAPPVTTDADVAWWARFDGADLAWAGAAVAPLGDVDGDGRTDVLIGASNHDRDGGHLHEGRAYAVRGLTADAYVLGEPTPGVAAWTGLDGDAWLGGAVAGVGDVDGDGRPDALVAAPRGGPTLDAGEVFLLYGDLPDHDGDTAVLAAASFHGDRLDELGTVVVGLGDFDGDGWDDFALGAPLNGAEEARAGAVYVVFGSGE